MELYLTTHSTHYIYGYRTSDMVKDLTDIKRNVLPPLLGIPFFD